MQERWDSMIHDFSKQLVKFVIDARKIQLLETGKSIKAILKIERFKDRDDYMNMKKGIQHRFELLKKHIVTCKISKLQIMSLQWILVSLNWGIVSCQSNKQKRRE